MSAAVTRVLPADIYAVLRATVALHGGVGAGQFYDGVAPCCIRGYAMEIDRPTMSCPVTTALIAADIGVLANDTAVRAINGRRWFGLRRVIAPFGGCNARVPFAAWCAELGVERGA